MLVKFGQAQSLPDGHHAYATLPQDHLAACFAALLHAGEDMLSILGLHSTLASSCSCVLPVTLHC